jgi:hypothetical protein
MAFFLDQASLGELSTVQWFSTTRKEFTRKDLKERTTRGKTDTRLKQIKIRPYGGIRRWLG